MTEITDDELNEIATRKTIVWRPDILATALLQAREQNAALKQAGLTMGEIIDRKNDQIAALKEKLRLAEEDAERLLPFTQHGADCNTRLDNECNCGLTHAKWQRLDHIAGGVA